MFFWFANYMAIKGSLASDKSLHHRNFYWHSLMSEVGCIMTPRPHSTSSQTNAIRLNCSSVMSGDVHEHPVTSKFSHIFWWRSRKFLGFVRILPSRRVFIKIVRLHAPEGLVPHSGLTATTRNNVVVWDLRLTNLNKDTKFAVFAYWTPSQKLPLRSILLACSQRLYLPGLQTVWQKSFPLPLINSLHPRNFCWQLLISIFIM